MVSDAFSAQIVQLVRNMPDEAILALVKNQLGAVASAAGVIPARRPGRPPGRPAAAAAAAPAPARAAKQPAKRAGKRGGRRGASSADRQETLDKVERIVKSSQGLSSSEVATVAGIPQTRAAAALKELKIAKRIFQGGDRRFARYAADAKTAEQASLASRTSASGPQGAKKAGKGRKRAAK